MQEYSLAHVDDAVLLRDLTSLVVRDRLNTALLLAHIGEVDARKLYVPIGFPSMHAYCVEELGLSEDAAYKRIQAARAARQIPALLDALAQGELHLAGICLLAPHLTLENANDLIRAVSRKRKMEIETYLARRFGRSCEVSRVTPVSPIVSAVNLQLAPGQVETDPDSESRSANSKPSDDIEAEPEDLPDENYFLQVTISKETYEKLRYARDLLSHALPGQQIAPVLDRALDLLITQLEKRKFGVTDRSRDAQLAAKDARTRARREKRAYAADQEWRRAAKDQTQDVIAGLKSLGYRPHEAKRAAEYCESMACATLEERLRAALGYLGGRFSIRPGT